MHHMLIQKDADHPHFDNTDEPQARGLTEHCQTHARADSGFAEVNARIAEFSSLRVYHNGE